VLTLFEELFLLNIRDGQSVVIPPIKGKLPYGLTGAILDELVLQSKVQVNQNHRLEVVDTSNTGDEILDKALRDLQDTDRPRKAAYWVELFSTRPKKFQKLLFDRMVSCGILLNEDDNIRWAIPSKVYTDQNASAKYCIKDRLRSIVLADKEMDLRSLTLLSILQASNSLKLVYTKDERQEARKRIHELLVSEALKNPVAQVIEEIQTAVASQ
jgi:hypothetical protein